MGGLSGGAAAVVASADLAGLAAGGGAHAGEGHGTSTTCLNCSATLAPNARFCSQCGQDTANHPPSLFEFAHEFISHYIAVEGTLWKSLWGLMAKPGFLTREYLAGRKQRYVLPLRLILTLGLLFFLALKFSASGVNVLDADEAASDEVAVSEPAASAASASAPAAPASAAHAKRAKRHAGDAVVVDDELTAQLPAGMQDRVNRAKEHWRANPKEAAHVMGATMLGLAPYAVLCSLPFFAGLLKLLFWRQPYGAHFVFAMHLHAAWYGMLLIAVLLPWGLVAFAVWGLVQHLPGGGAQAGARGELVDDAAARRPAGHAALGHHRPGPARAGHGRRAGGGLGVRKKRLAPQVGVHVHQHAGQLQRAPQRLGHGQDGLGGARLADPGTDLGVLLVGEQAAVAHLVECLHAQPFIAARWPQQGLGSRAPAVTSCANWRSWPAAPWARRR